MLEGRSADLAWATMSFMSLQSMARGRAKEPCRNPHARMPLYAPTMPAQRPNPMTRRPLARLISS